MTIWSLGDLGDTDKLTNAEWVMAVGDAGIAAAGHVLWWNLGREGVEPDRETLLMMERVAKAMRTQDPDEVEWASNHADLYMGYMRMARREGGMQFLEDLVTLAKEKEEPRAV